MPGSARSVVPDVDGVIAPGIDCAPVRLFRWCRSRLHQLYLVYSLVPEEILLPLLELVAVHLP